MSLIDDAPEGVNTPEFSVSELSGAVKRMVEGEFGHVRVRGEVGRVSRPRSGHVYLDLKDDRSVLAGVMWKGVAARLSTQPEEGMEVVATGRLTTFPGQSKYQIVIEDIAPAGMGALMAMLEKRKAALTAEGLFAADRKRPIPYLPRMIGVVTSPSGAVIRDILHRLGERFPTHVLIWPVAVQGAKCAPEVAAAIRGFSDMQGARRPDVIIVARGGGSVEDLWGFNEEVVVRAVADCPIPVISAVGHETDTTLIDYAADLRAPTPTAAAERAVPVRADLRATVADLEARRLRALAHRLERSRTRLSDLARALPRPERLLEERRQRLDNTALRIPDPRRALQAKRDILGRLTDRLPSALARTTQAGRIALTRHASPLTPRRLQEQMVRGRERVTTVSARLPPAIERATQRQRDRFESISRLYGSLHYEQTLKRGFAVVRGKDGVIADAARVRPGAMLEIQFRDGRLAVRPEGGSPDEAESTKTPARPKPKARPKKADPGNQGSLF